MGGVGSLRKLECMRWGGTISFLQDKLCVCVCVEGAGSFHK